MKKAILVVLAALFLPTVVPSPSEASVVRFVVERTRRIADEIGRASCRERV